ncbi:MAG TPA: erythromycin esterase family protein, partial [Kofleriaceae bacterium]
VRADGTFSACLPDGHYSAMLRGPVVSLYSFVDLTASGSTTNVEIDGLAATQVEQPPPEVVQVPADLEGLVGDILARDARLIGLGEATHGTAELTTSRGTLTFELIRRAKVRLVMFEVDAILATAVDDYVMGGDVDLGKAVANLGFWITDTYELLRFFEDLRAYNATTRDKVHVWGVDVQYTQPAVSLLLTHARALKLTDDDKQLLEKVAEKRAAPVRELTPERRAALDALLQRLLKRRGKSQTDLRIAVAVRSLIVQIGYLDGDTAGLIAVRRDAGMASVASYLVTQTKAPRACIWAHAAHVARADEVGIRPMGEHLAAFASHRYYPIGFFIYEGSVRAWDAAGAIGVISHPIPRAPDFAVEGAVMSATGSPDIAWLPSSRFSPVFRKWLETPRYLREAGAVYSTEADLMTLYDVPAAFDALVVIKSGHDSSPTPTGLRKADN